jgi:hypothetical protein
MRSNRDERGVEAASILLREQILDLVIEDDADAHRLDPLHLAHQLLAR